jgi:hypothetical protein
MDKVVLEEIKEEERKERKDKWTKWPIVLGNIANRITVRIVEKHARAWGTFWFSERFRRHEYQPSIMWVKWENKAIMPSK